MAYTLQLTDGTTTVDFLGSSGTSWCLLEDGGLSIEQPQPKSIWAGRTTATHGRRLTSSAYDNRRVTITFEIVGTTRANILDKQQDIISILENAKRRQMYNTAMAVTLEYKVDNATASVYFDVLSGELRIPDDFMSLEKQQWMKGSQYTVKGWVLELMCKPFARGAEVNIVSSQTVYAIDDATYNNYVSWSGSAILGDVPGPLRIRYQNTYTTAAQDLYVGLRDMGTLASFPHVLESADATLLQGGSMGGSTATWSSIATGELAYWTITPISGLTYKGKVRVIGVTESTAFDDDVRFYLRSSYLELTTLMTNPDVRGQDSS